jgi:hypothetical protein
MAAYYEEQVEPWPPWDSAGYRMARGLGWFSLALGAAELLAPRSLARWLGMESQAELIRLYGMREIANGVAILSQEDPTPWVWARVGGDALDLATLAPAYRNDNPRRDNVGIAMAAVAGAALLDVVCAQQLTARRPEPRPIPDYGDRSGFPKTPDAMRGVARDFEIPRDMRIPEAMRPYART